MHKTLRNIILALSLVALVFSLSACRRTSDREITILFESNSESELSSLNVKESQNNLTLPEPTKEGHTFLGWTKNPNTSQLFELKDVDWTKTTITLYAIWEVNQYVITFVSNNASSIENQTYSFGQSLNLPVLEDTEYTFGGWFLDEELTHRVTYSTMPSKDLTLYGLWYLEDDLFGTNTLFFNTVLYTENSLVLTLMIGGDVRFSGYDIEILYDKDKATLISHQSHLSNIVNDSVPGILRFNYVDALNRILEETQLITLTFDIKDNENIIIEIHVVDILDVTETYEIINIAYRVIHFELD